MLTHETFITTIADAALARLTADERHAFDGIKLVYGSGPNGTRGVTFFNRWAPQGSNGARPFVEISAFGQESPIQLAGTTLHELAHVLAGVDAGHGPKWKAACERLGLRVARAAGTQYLLASLDARLRYLVSSLGTPQDGKPVSFTDLFGAGFVPKLKPCGAGVGTRGGKSRGPGSGSRLRLWQCSCGCKARVASDTFEAVHTPCGTAFKQA